MKLALSSAACVVLLSLKATLTVGQVEGDRNQRTIEPEQRRSSIVLARIDEHVVREFKQAWDRAKHGIVPEEAIVIIFLMRDGSIKAVQGRFTNESKRLGFMWNQAIYAIVHTHPNQCPPEPSSPDILFADRFHVPIFTITNRGMYLYDPETNMITTVHERLVWLEPKAWVRYSQAIHNSQADKTTPTHSGPSSSRQPELSATRKALNS